MTLIHVHVTGRVQRGALRLIAAPQNTILANTIHKAGNARAAVRLHAHCGWKRVRTIGTLQQRIARGAVGARAADALININITIACHLLVAALRLLNRNFLKLEFVPLVTYDNFGFRLRFFVYLPLEFL